MTKRIGLLGGTFDPVHTGHLLAAKTVKTSLQLDDMYLLPLATPVHKQPPVANQQQRLRCLQLALCDFPGLKIETAELERLGSSYTVDTLRYLSEQQADVQYYWVLGTDAFNSFTSWKSPDEILDLANLIVVTRPDTQLSADIEKAYAKSFCSIEQAVEKKAGAIAMLDIPPMPISSTALRALLADENKSAASYMPEPVYDYINQEKIYVKKRELMNVEEIKDQIVNALDDIKGIDITILPVGDMTSVADYLIVASGSSDRQVKSLANNVLMKLKEQDIRPLGVEGEREGQWILIDYADILVHIMLPTVRDFYNLEKLWEHRPNTAEEG